MSTTEDFERFQSYNFEVRLLQNENFFRKGKVKFFSRKCYERKNNISIQNCSVKKNNFMDTHREKAP